MDTELPLDVVLRVRSFVIRTLRYEIADTENYFETGLVSSMFGMQLIAFLEKAFSFEVTDDDLVLENFKSIENVARFVQSKMKRQ